MEEEGKERKRNNCNYIILINLQKRNKMIKMNNMKNFQMKQKKIKN